MQKYISALALFLLGMPLAVFAVGLGGFDIALPNGITITSAGDSSANTMTINSDNVEFALSSGQSIHLVSANRYILNNNQSTKTGCSATQSTLDYELPDGITSITLTVTPSTTTCSTGGGGGGGGGSSGGVSLPGSPDYSTSAPASPATTPAATVASLQVQQTPAAIVSPVFNANLRVGARSNDVTRLQTLLGQDSAVYPEKIVSGYFGPKTLAAVKRFQRKYGISPVSGIVGPLTRAKLNMIFGATVPATPAVPGETPAVPATPAPVAQPDVTSIQALIQSLQAQIQALQQQQSAPKPTGGCVTALNSNLICLP